MGPMKTSSSQDPGDGAAGDYEPTPLPPPPPAADFDDEDDHYFDDDDEPSWWSAIRPLSAVHASPRSSELDVLAPVSVPMRLPALPAPVRTRMRSGGSANDQVHATVHVLRVRARLSPEEQRAFDALMCGPAATDLITMLVNRSEDDALDKLRRRLDDEPNTVERSRRSLVAQIIGVSALLSAGEKARAFAALGRLWPEELVALQARLERLPAPEAAALIRTYLGV